MNMLEIKILFIQNLANWYQMGIFDILWFFTFSHFFRFLDGLADVDDKAELLEGVDIKWRGQPTKSEFFGINEKSFSIFNFFLVLIFFKGAVVAGQHNIVLGTVRLGIFFFFLLSFPCSPFFFLFPRFFLSRFQFFFTSYLLIK